MTKPKVQGPGDCNWSMTAKGSIKIDCSESMARHRLAALACLILPTVCLANPIPWIPTAYGGVAIKHLYVNSALVLIVACGLGVEYVVLRYMTNRLGVKPLAWLAAFLGVHVVSWPLATYLVSRLDHSHLFNTIAEAIGPFSLLILVGLEVLIGLVEGLAFAFIFLEPGASRRWIRASVVGNLCGFVTGLAVTLTLEFMVRSH